jgi:RimJ/RimL family protein N-acetyltransferase
VSRFPDQLDTSRLLLRAPLLDDAQPLNDAIVESFAELNQWMPWAAQLPSVDDTLNFCRESGDRVRAGDAYPVIMIEKATGAIVGASGIERCDWSVPSVEVGYWCRTPRTGRGFVGETAAALTRFAFDKLDAVRVEIRMDDRNVRSWRVAERLGFQYEGLLRRDARDTQGGLRDTRVYSLIDVQGLRERH